MPVYDFKCLECGHRFEAAARMADPNPPCPNVRRSADQDDTDGSYECGGETEKLISASAVHFHGGGWAADNYSRKP